MAGINPYFISLYAMRMRGVGRNLGYPRQVPWYTPSRTGETHNDQKIFITDDDWWIVDQIERFLGEIKQTKPSLVISFNIWHGAYTGAESGRSKRCKHFGVPYGKTQKAALRCESLLERMMYAQ